MRKVSFADLTHTGQIVSANTFPLGSVMVAAYARKCFSDEINVEVFRYPDDFSKYLENNTPQICCFSIYTWNTTLSHEYAKRIKVFYPGTITVFGGANFPLVKDEQREFLIRYPGIDFFIEGDGEIAFAELFKALKEVDFNCSEFKRQRTVSPNIRYIADGEIIAGDMLPRIKDLDIIPSTFENGLSDKFFDDVLTPMIETTRGCPYSCTFCHDGPSHYNKIGRFSLDRIKWELNYIARRTKVPELIITDLNFGLFEEDVEVAREIAVIRKETNWPQYNVIATAKNNKDRIMEISRLLKGSLAPGATVQSTDAEVLKSIKRKNLSLEDLVEIANTRATDNASAMSEVILCLPGDTKNAHFKSVFDMVDIGMSLLRNHQFMLLESSEAATRHDREKFKMDTRYRIQPRCFGTYSIKGEDFICAEIEEICVANSTMSYLDYQECRDLDLSVEIFINDAIFCDLLYFLNINNILSSAFLKRVHDKALQEDGGIAHIYKEFRNREKKNLSSDREELNAFFNRPGIIDHYVKGEYGFNELYTYRAIAIFHNMEAVHEIAFGVARNLLKETGNLSERAEQYITELHEFSLMRKGDFLNQETTAKGKFHFDFVRLTNSNFTANPDEVFHPNCTEIEVYHTDLQKEHIKGLVKQYGLSLVGLARFFSRAQISALYRNARYLNEEKYTESTVLCEGTKE